MSSPASDLYVEVQVSDKQPGTSNETKKSQKMSKRAAFDATRALRGIGSTGESATADSACRVRGDGRYANGTNFLREGNKVHIGPEAFTASNLGETMEQLNRFGAFGTKGDRGAETATGGNETSDRAASRVSAASAPSSGGLDLQMVRDLETILTLSEQQSRAAKLEDSQSAMYNIDDSDDDDDGEGAGAGARDRQAEKKVPHYEARWLPTEENPTKFEVRVSMPETASIGEVSLQVESTKQHGRVLSLSSPTYHLKVPVDGARGGAGKAQSLKLKAKWRKEKKVLKVTLAV